MLSPLSPCTHSFFLTLYRLSWNLSYLHAIISFSFPLSLSYSFLCTWPWLFPHGCGFPSPPLWQLHINHFYIHRKTASFTSLHSISFSPVQSACIFLTFFFCHNYALPCSLILSSYLPSSILTLFMQQKWYLLPANCLKFAKMLQKVLHRYSTARIGVNLTNFVWNILWEIFSWHSQQNALKNTSSCFGGASRFRCWETIKYDSGRLVWEIHPFVCCFIRCQNRAVV